MNELRNRGVQDILIAIVDGVQGVPEAITAAFRDATVQTCPRHGLSAPVAAEADDQAEAAMTTVTFIDLTPAQKEAFAA